MHNDVGPDLNALVINKLMNVQVTCSGCGTSCYIQPKNVTRTSNAINLGTGTLTLVYRFDPMTHFCTACGKLYGTR